MTAGARPRFGRGFRLLASPHPGRFPLTDRSNRIVPMVLLAGVLALAGCGVKGPLEPPVGTEAVASPNPLQTTITSDSPGPSVTSTPTQTASSKAFMSRANRKDGKMPSSKKVKHGGVPLTSEPQKPDRPFLLDKLL